MKTLQLCIEGVVQGVGYRAWAVREARLLGLAGWVRNRRDGSVEALVQGPEAAVDRFVAAAQRGPSVARVSRIATETVEAAILSSFTERETV